MISPALYEKFVLPHDGLIGEALGNVAIHFCGNGPHQISTMLATPNLGSLDFGQPWMMDIDDIYAAAADRKVGLTRVTVPEDQRTAEKVSRRFPTGMNLVYYAKSVTDARRVWSRYIGDQDHD
jgi:hypothetical protein